MVEVNICENVLYHRVDDVARLEIVVDTRRGLSLNDVLLVVRRLTIELLRYGLVNADRQHQLVGVGTHLHMIEQPGRLGERRLFQLLWGEVVECYGETLVFVVAVIVVVGQIGLLLCRHHALHQFYGRVVLAAVATA